jgi:hypothetical protein
MALRPREVAGCEVEGLYRLVAVENLADPFECHVADVGIAVDIVNNEHAAEERRVVVDVTQRRVSGDFVIGDQTLTALYLPVERMGSIERRVRWRQVHVVRFVGIEGVALKRR